MSTEKPAKSSPIPVRLEEEVTKMIERLTAATGISRSEIIRRAVRFALARAQESGSLNFLFGDEQAIREALQAGGPREEKGAKVLPPVTLPSPEPLPPEPLAPPFSPTDAPPASPGDFSRRNIV